MRRSWLAPDPDATWRDAALCAQADPELFFPENGASTEAAEAICRTCTVRRDCLLDSLDEPFGIWAGLDPRQRRYARCLLDGGATPEDVFAITWNGSLPHSARAALFPFSDPERKSSPTDGGNHGDLSYAQRPGRS